MSFPSMLMETQAGWLEPARRILLRDVHIGRRRRILELGCGTGAVTFELVRRCNGTVVALDRDRGTLEGNPMAFHGAQRICSDARRLPFKEATFDLAFSQCTFLWIIELSFVASELARVLSPDGVLVALEPDYGGMMEYPPEIATQRLWTAVLKRAGANPMVGRELPGTLEEAGFNVRVNFFSQLHQPDPKRFQLLRSLPLTEDEIAEVERIDARDKSLGQGWKRVVHLPFFLITANKKRILTKHEFLPGKL